jgi:RND family efflux transporter MFP subunit
MLLLMAWLAGWFHDKQPPEEGESALPSAQGLPVFEVRAATVPSLREVRGRIEAEHEIAVAAKVLAEVKAVKVSAGDPVITGQLLVLLDDRKQTEQLNAAKAALDQAQDDYDKVMRLKPQGHATEREVTAATTALEAAKARYREAKAAWDDTRVTAPADGMVIDRYCEVGDTVRPGQTVVRMFDRLQMMAEVPESLREHVALGQELKVYVDAVDKSCTGTVSEIIQQADVTSRSFQVKVTGPCQGGVMIGNSAKLRIPTGTRELVLVPPEAVSRVGQVAVVFKVIQRDGESRHIRQFVQTGPTHDGMLVITSGLAAGDRIIADADRAATRREGA